MCHHRLTSRQFTLAALLAVGLFLPPIDARADDSTPPGDVAVALEQREVLYHNTKAGRVLFLGNSITLHGPAPAIGWQGNWGMAASAEDKDFVHLILQAISSASNQEPQSLVTNIASFEREYATYDLEAGLARELAFKPDLVVLAIGENVPALASDQDKARFRARFAKLLKRLQEDSNPVIVVRSCFWENEAKDTIMREACREAGGIFVDAAPLGRDERNYARSERDFSHAGVAAHPGDQGMKALAEAILLAIRKRR